MKNDIASKEHTQMNSTLIQNALSLEGSMVKVLISYSKLANNKGQVSVTFER